MLNREKVAEVLERMETEDAIQRNKGLESGKRWRSISRDVAEALNLLARSCNAKNIVEIGTSHGYSTIWLALAAKSAEGKVITFEIEEWKQKKAKENISEIGLSQYVDFILSDPRKNTDGLPNDIDFVFLDCEKKDYLSHFKALFEKLRPGGTVVADNAISHFADLREYINYVRMGEKTSSVMIPLGNGLEITYKFLENEKETKIYFDLIR